MQPPCTHLRHATVRVILVTVLSTGTAACGGGGSPSQKPAPREAGGATMARGATTTKGRSAPPPERPATGRSVAWTHAELLRRLEGHSVRVERRVVPIDRDTVTCGGDGPPTSHRRRQPEWTRFRCVQPTFPAGVLAGPDLVFIVAPTGRRSFAVSGQRFTSY